MHKARSEFHLGITHGPFKTRTVPHTAAFESSPIQTQEHPSDRHDPADRTRRL